MKKGWVKSVSLTLAASLFLAFAGCSSGETGAAVSKEETAAVENGSAEDSSAAAENGSAKDDSAAAKEAAFTFWDKDAEALNVLVDYVEEVTDESSENYIPEKDRIAVFDMDGTLYGERFPTYFNDWLFIQRALSPAKVSSIVLDQENRKAEVYLQPEEVSLAIGRGGMNIKLASMLTEYTIDVFRVVSEGEADEDIYLDEFADEIDQWVIDSIKAIGLDTAKAVLNAPREMLIEKADLEEETVDHLLGVLRAEFE